MGTASFCQNSFLGGEWSQQMQGRFDREDYRTGLNLCFNVIPIEEGAAPRRSGTRLGGVTRNGAYGVLREYNVDQRQPYNIELTAGKLRIWQADAELVVHTGTTVTDISTATPAVFTSAGHGLSTGDQVIFVVGSADSWAGISQVLGRQLSVTVSGSTFTAVDALTGAEIDGSTIDFSTLSDVVVFRIYELDTDYTEDDLQQIRIVQDGADALLLHHKYKPQVFAIQTNADGTFSSATIADAIFYDGPYLDIPTDGTTITKSGSHYVASSIASINDGAGFQSTDVGRMIRLFSEPEDWDPANAPFAAGTQVKDADTYWVAVGDGANDPGLRPSTNSGRDWVIDVTAAAWTWGTITAVNSTTSVDVTLHASVKYPENTAGGSLLHPLQPIVAWQLGAYSDTTLYPSIGAYYQGRVWLAGAIKNRFDACVSNDFAVNGYINFAPTGRDGTVADNNGIAGTLNAKEIENFLWILPDEQGVLAGTQSGEWVIASSSMGEPITPTSILTRETTKYGSADTPAVKVGRATIFVHRDTRKIYEYMANYFTQKFVADNLSLKAKHLTVSGIAEIAYMRELTPVIWARREDGTLIGCTYKHDDPIKPLEFAGWHQHWLGTNRIVISIQGGPANGGKTDTLSMVTQDTVTNFCYVEFLQTIWDDDDDLTTAWYLDGAVKAAAAERIDDTTVRIYGLWYFIGGVVTAWGAGLDLGDYAVSDSGTIDLPLNVADSLFTDALLADVTALGCTSLSTDIVCEAAPANLYIMEAKENFDSAHISTIAGLTTYTANNFVCDQNYQGIQWDAVRRNLMYLYAENLATTPTTNTTGHTLWDGTSSYAPGATMDPGHQFNTSIGVKNIDSDAVTFHLTYDATKLVPAGIGGGDGTWRRATLDFFADSPTQGGNGPGMTDPYTGNFWTNSASCPLYCFRLQDNYAMTISPVAPMSDVENDLVQVVGFTTQGASGPWTFAREIDNSGFTGTYLYLIPKDYTAEEIAADYLLKYATFLYPGTFDANVQNYHQYNREVFDHSGNMYVFSCQAFDGKDFKLYKFTLPTSAPYGGPTVGGGFTDITPWTADTGPNADGSGYEHQRNDFSQQLPTGAIIPMYLPATDDLVLIEKFFPQETDGLSYDPALMKWSCTYVHDPSGTPTFDHHSAFVTGYMTAEWAPTNITSAAYAVYDAFEVNSYLGQSDYDYTTAGLDYTTRWFFFVCKKMSGVSDNSPRIVLVEYSFVYGSAPTVTQVIDEQGWDDAYPNYGPFDLSIYPPYDSESTNAVAASMETWFNVPYYYPKWDVGIHDPVTNSFWWSGGGGNDADSTATFCRFDSTFSDRMQHEDATPGGTIIGATPPFMKLSFGRSYCVPFVLGSTYISQCQILRPATPQESMTQTGPSLGKFRRATDAMVLFNDAQGVSMGVDFLKMYPVQFKKTNGVGLAGGGRYDLPINQTFSGIAKAPVAADSNFDNMWCWQITRPYPCTVVAIEVQHKANENV